MINRMTIVLFLVPHNDVCSRTAKLTERSDLRIELWVTTNAWLKNAWLINYIVFLLLGLPILI